MNTEQKNAWVSALRSGEFKQIKGSLSCDGGYCCLGVLLKVNDISIKDHNGWDNYSAIKHILGTAYNRDFSTMNDVQGLSFSEIADFIEKIVEED